MKYLNVLSQYLNVLSQYLKNSYFTAPGGIIPGNERNFYENHIETKLENKKQKRQS